MSEPHSDLWHFVCDEPSGTWTWKRLSVDGEELDRSDFSFQSFNVCVADAERAGFVSNTKALRRFRSADLDYTSSELSAGANAFARRRRTRSGSGLDSSDA